MKTIDSIDRIYSSLETLKICDENEHNIREKCEKIFASFTSGNTKNNAKQNIKIILKTIIKLNEMNLFCALRYSDINSVSRGDITAFVFRTVNYLYPLFLNDGRKILFTSSAPVSAEFSPRLIETAVISAISEMSEYGGEVRISAFGQNESAVLLFSYDKETPLSEKYAHIRHIAEIHGGKMLTSSDRAALSIPKKSVCKRRLIFKPSPELSGIAQINHI